MYRTVRTVVWEVGISQSREIPPTRFALKQGAIDFNLQDGSDYEGNYELLTGTTVLREAIEMVDHYKGNPLVQKAMADVDKYLEDKAKSVEKTTTKKCAATKKKETKEED